jgi:hypothetical protein
MHAARLGARRLLSGIALAGAVSAPCAALADGSWIDKKLIAPWNVHLAELPRAAKAQESFERCRSQLRPPETREDRAVAAAGWKLYAPYELFGGTAIVLAMSDVDGMCRPVGYQGFVFVHGTYAGTLSPRPMDSRTDGALQRPLLFGATSFSAEFERYAASDPLCCPSRSSVVEYKVERRDGRPLVVPVSATTNSNTR